MTTATVPLGTLLRDWRRRRRLSQLDLALEAGVSARHLSFVETGRSRPSADMVLQLAEELDVPLRNRNQLLLAAGHAPVFEQHDLEDPEMAPVRRAIDLILDGHDPYPAVVIDRAWEMLGANRAVALLIAGVAPDLLEPPVNVLRLSLHPQGLAPRIANLAEWRAHLLARLRRQIEVSADPVLTELLRELEAYPSPNVRKMGRPASGHEYAGVLVPVQFITEQGLLSFFSTTTVFGTPLDITLSELALESFFPADAATGETLRDLAASSRP